MVMEVILAGDGEMPKVGLHLGHRKGLADYWWANLPRSVLTKRHWSPLALSSRNMAEYSVAAGVRPPGLLQ